MVAALGTRRQRTTVLYSCRRRTQAYCTSIGYRYENCTISSERCIFKIRRNSGHVMQSRRVGHSHCSLRRALTALRALCTARRMRCAGAGKHGRAVLLHWRPGGAMRATAHGQRRASWVSAADDGGPARPGLRRKAHGEADSHAVRAPVPRFSGALLRPGRCTAPVLRRLRP